VLSPARADLADGTRVKEEFVPVKATEAQVAATPDPAPASGRAAPPAVTGSADPDDAVISSALSAHVDSIVNDARRNVGKYSAAR
jgi:hypothetical protein